MIDILIILLFTVGPAGLLYLGYRKTKKQLVKYTATKIHEGLPDPDDPVILHGHDLSKWHYLGFSNCSYVDENGTKTASYPIFLFASKNNEKRRSYHCSSGAKNHTFVERYIKPWAAGEGEIYVRIQGESNSPSDYLKAYMLDRFDCEWDDDTNWWGSSDKAKYNSANNKQKRERKTKTENKTESNVVTVDFGKQA